MLKLSVSEGGNYPTGWHTVTITNAHDGDFDGTRYIDLHFKDLPENLKCRVWSAVNSTTGEDFGIGNLFHYANAGITDSDDGTVSIDDNVRHLKGKTLNVLFYEKSLNLKLKLGSKVVLMVLQQYILMVRRLMLLLQQLKK